MNEEPSVLDYIKSKLNPRKYPAVDLTLEKPAPPGTPSELHAPEQPQIQKAPHPYPTRVQRPWPWRTLLALAIALFAQRSLEPGPGRSLVVAAVIYLLSAVLLGWAFLIGELHVPELPADERNLEPQSVYATSLFISIPLALAAFLAFSGNLFTALNLALWYLAIVFLLRAFWLGKMDMDPFIRRMRAFIMRPTWSIHITRWAVLLLAGFALAVFFHLYRLSQVPPEMTSDHAEKLLDVWDVLHGQTHIFFPRNTGREFIQFYLTAGVATLFGTGISFISLKIGTMIFGLLTLPFIYLLGKELGHREIGFWAALFAGIAYWPNVITHMALRFILYPAFVAPTLYFLVRGLRRNKRNDFILSGLFLGLGLHGYTPIRILPFVVVAAVLIYLLHRQARGVRKDTLMHLGILAITALFIFLPLLRYAQENPAKFESRAFTRLGTLEQPFPGPPLQIFLQNVWNGLLMFNWDNGEIWVTSIPHRPALEIVSGALFILGVVLVALRYYRRRQWQDIFLLLSIPMLSLPSTLSLAFPSENPNLGRAGGAFAPVFLVVGVAMFSILAAVRQWLGDSTWGPRLAFGLGALLVFWSAAQNYDLLFNQYYKEFALSDWNSSEMGQVIRDFADTVGTPDTAWVVPYPYWVDTRLVGMNAGYPTKDYAIPPDQLQTTLTLPGPKLFLVDLQDQDTIVKLNNMYPNGFLKEYHSKYPDKDFLEFFVPPS
jgi:4-amino-4-deoxy-L-arabinose transferase-like glycosyltransferase